MSDCKACNLMTPRNLVIAGLSLAGLFFAYKKFCPLACKKTTADTTATGADAKTVQAAAKSLADDVVLNAVVMSGPSGVGKGTLIDKVKKDFPDAFAVSVSHTSRAPRTGEVDGVNYHYSDKATMQAMDARGEFLELCEVHGNLYGTSVAALKAVRDSGKVCIIECDVNGSQKIRAKLANEKDLKAGFMFVTCPSISDLEARITKRGGEDKAQIDKRLVTARTELAFLNSEAGVKHFDYVLVNDDLDKAYAEFKAFLTKHKCLK